MSDMSYLGKNVCYQLCDEKLKLKQNKNYNIRIKITIGIDVQLPWKVYSKEK